MSSTPCRNPRRAFAASFAASITMTLQLASSPLAAQELTAEQQQQILAKTQTLRLAPSLAALSAGEQEALRHLLAVGEIFQRLYEDSRHPQAASFRASLGSRGPAVVDLYRLSQGPIVTTLDNRRAPLAAEVAPETPGRNVYPPGITAAEVEAFLTRHPEARGEILGERTVVRRADAASLRRDLAILASFPVVAALQPGLAERLAALESGLTSAAQGAPTELYAVPYSVAYAEELVAAQKHLFAAAAALEADDREFAGYLRNRGRDLLANDYESGDAAWVTGHFGNLNAEIGAYETYDDALFGVKAFHAVSLLVRDEAATRELRQKLGSLQAIEDALPYEPKKRVRADIPVGVYEVIADFGQARGANTATILPNDPLFARRYGRTILMRRNIILQPELAATASRRFAAAMAPEFAATLQPEGGFERTLWHEIGHYLGPDQTRDGRSLDQALGTRADSLEEMKSDLVSLFAHEQFFAKGFISAERLRAVRASGILRTLQDVAPRRDQAYAVMQLAQLNYFLEHGLLSRSEGKLAIHFERYAAVVADLLREVLELQNAGDAAAVEAFFARWTTWTPEHEALGQRLRAAAGPRFRLLRYAALGE